MSGFASHALRGVPLTILVVTLLLGLKSVELAQVLLPFGTTAGGMVAAAQAEPAPAAAHTAAPPPAPSPPAAPPRTQAAAADATPAEPAISPAERQLLQDLRGRRAELDTRERILAQREGVLDAAEHRLTARITELSGLQARLEQLDAARRAHDDANWAGLVKVYESMKPREAAAILNEMDMPVLVQVIDRMRDAKAAIILGAMQPDRARLATAQLAALRTRSTTVPPGSS